MRVLEARFRIIWYILLMSVLRTWSLHGQTDNATNGSHPMHIVGASVGFNDFHIRDEYVSPFSYHGVFFCSILSYQLGLSEACHRVGVSFGKGKVSSDAQSRDVTQYTGSFSYSYLHAVQTWEVGERPLVLSIGAGTSSFFTKTHLLTPPAINWYASYDETWYWSHALDIHLHADYSLSGGSVVSAEISSPLLSVVSRPADAHYRSMRNIRVDENFLNAATKGRLEYLWDNVAVHGAVEYDQRWNGNVSFRARYEFAYASSDTPFPMAFYLNNFQVGMAWSL